MKMFSTTGACSPEKNYMVDLGKQLQQIRSMVDAGQYFTINRARQYGKTTTLAALSRQLQDSYDVISLDFQGLDDSSFKDSGTFSQVLAQMLIDENEFGGVQIPEQYVQPLEEICQRAPDRMDGRCVSYF